ncbi:MAG: hypothetical protein ACI9CA_000459 [Natronomonas sp.]|jgi:hypothetical protein
MVALSAVNPAEGRVARTGGSGIGAVVLDQSVDIGVVLPLA